MPTPTYAPLATVTLGSAASSVTFSSIPGTYRDLILIMDGTSSVGINGSVYFNSDTTAANYPYTRMNGNGSTASSNSGNNIWFDFQTSRSMVRIQIMDYSATDKHTTSLSRWDNPSSVVGATAIRWANTAAVTSLQVKDTNNSATFASGTTFSLYGVIA
jgi:hypothetical protein